MELIKIKPINAGPLSQLITLASQTYEWSRQQYDHSRQPPMRSLSGKAKVDRYRHPKFDHFHSTNTRESVIPTFPSHLVGGSFGNIRRPAANNYSWPVGGRQRRIPNLRTTTVVRQALSAAPWNWFRQVVVTFTTTTTPLRGEFTCIYW